MTGDGRDLAAFARTVVALEPYLRELVFVGGWAHYLHTLTPEAAPLPFTPLATQDLDVAVPLGLSQRGKSIAARLEDAGFKARFKGEHRPPVAEYALGDDHSGFYVEFLAPLRGGEVKRGGRMDVTTRTGGVTAQTLRHLDILLMAPWRVTISGENGFPVPSPTVVSIPNPAAYVVQKVLVLGKRIPADVAKDVLYVHDTFSIFTDSLPRIRGEWDALPLERARATTFRKQVRSLLAKPSDAVLGAVRIAEGRPRAPSADLLLAGLRRGFEAGFGVAPSETSA